MAEINPDKILTSDVVNKFLHYFVGVRNRDDINKCWPWNGRIDSNGYGNLDVKNLSYLAHRISYLYHNNMIQSELQVLHKPIICKSRSCINYYHLYLGDHKKNMNDKYITQTCNSGDHKGELNSSVKLTNEIVLKIRFERYAFNLTYTYLGKKYNVDSQTISNICNYKTWRHI